MSFFAKPKVVRVALTGGGSGGHVFPLIAIYRQLSFLASKNQINLEVAYFGPADFTLDLIKKEGIPVKPILSGKLRRSFNPKDILMNFIDIFKLFLGFFQALAKLFVFMPDVVLSKGGFGSIPIMLSAMLYFIPRILHESDSVPGLTNVIFSRFSNQVYTAFDSSRKYLPARKTFVVGNPIRRNLLGGDYQKSRQFLGVGERPLLVVLGGSQGAHTINELILDSLPHLLGSIEIIHQTGPENFELVKRESKIMFDEVIKDDRLKNYYHPVPFLKEKDFQDKFESLKDVLWAADLIVSRAGSGAIFEIAALAKPSILIPFFWASRDHQTKNAYEYASNGAAAVIEYNNLTENVFSQLVLSIINDKETMEKMSEASRAFAKIDADKIIAIAIFELVGFKIKSE